MDRERECRGKTVRKGEVPIFCRILVLPPSLWLSLCIRAHDEAGKRVRLPTKGQIKWISTKQKTNLIKANLSRKDKLYG